MAVEEDGSHCPTENIISKTNRMHYRVAVRAQHWQLRSLIGAEKGYIVYFPGGHNCQHIQRLNTRTNECATIRLLTFAPRCLVVKDGWLCCGSEQGELVAVRLDDDEDNPDEPSATLPGFNSDNPGPVPTLGPDGIQIMVGRSRHSNKSLLTTNVKLAKDRVNCVTIWMPPTRTIAHELAYTVPVAVLANNDKTVSLVSMEDAVDDENTEALDVVHYPDFVNRALISPDGRLLIAILDDPFLYVRERTGPDSEAFSGSVPGGKTCFWELKRTIMLKSQRTDDQSENRGSFAACFSTSGAYLAVGTQHGTISIFDVNLLTDTHSDPLMTTFTSSRPKSGPGAIRDMAFCPGPFDILAWTEDRGHVGIADVRTNYVFRQIIDINAEANFRHINVFDRTTVDPRLLDRRTGRTEAFQPSASSLGSNFNVSNHRRQDAISGGSSSQLASGNNGGRALRTDRQRREQLNSDQSTPSRTGSEATPFSVRASPLSAIRFPNYTPPDFRGSSGYGNALLELESQRTQARGNATATTARSFGGLLVANYRDRRGSIHERTARMRQASRRPEPMPTASAPQDDGEHESADISYMSVLELLQRRERDSAGEGDEDTSLMVPLVNNPGARFEQNVARADQGFFDAPPSPDHTSGLSWSDDGRTLFIGAQNGIYELQVNIQDRKLFPSICPR